MGELPEDSVDGVVAQVAELGQRAAGGPVAWDLYLQLPEPSDPLTDASAAWLTEEVARTGQDYTSYILSLNAGALGRGERA